MPTFRIPRTRDRLTASAPCLPCELADDTAALDNVTLPDSGSANWSGPIVAEGVMTGDGRLIEPNALTWGDLPLPLRYVKSDVGAHDGAVVVGRILTLERKPDGLIYATGDFDLDSEEGREAARQVGAHLKNGVSVDLDNLSFEVRVARELLEDETVRPPAPEDIAEDAPITVEEDDEGRVTVVAIGSDDEVMVTNEARIRAATLVDVPAFAEARITLAVGDDAPAEAPGGDAPPADTADDGVLPDGTECSCDPDDDDYSEDCDCSADDEGTDAEGDGAEVLLSSGAPGTPPVGWFTNPGLTGPTPLTVTEDGRVYGHLAIWGTCHTGHPGQCVTPPHSAASYAYFRTGSVMTDDGEVPVGRITLDTTHARENFGPTAAIGHYEHTGRAAAYVAAGEDAHGIWLSGTVRPGLSEDQLRALRASPLSGDWRRIGGQLELIGALAVNLPGFPVPRPKGMVAGGRTMSLVASGMVSPSKVIAPGHPGALSTEDLRYLKRLAAREKAAEVDELADRRRRVKATALALRVRGRKNVG